MIELKHIYKEYQGVNVLKDINISFPSKGLVTILGSNGSGKTTLVNVLCGLVKPTAGEIICDGISLYSLSSDNIDELRKKYFSIIFQDQKTFDQLTLKNHIKLVLKLNYLVLTEEKKKEIEEILQKLKLIEHINKKIVSLSGGEKSRVSIAMALIKNSHVIIADEPTASQDAENAELVFNILKEISKTKLVILISHACQRAIEISDCYFELDKGQIKNYQPKNDLNKDNNTITFTKSHLFKNFSIFKYTNKKNKFDSIFTFIFLTLSLVFSTLSFSIMSFNQAKFAKDYLAKSNINYIMVDEDENTQLDLNKIPEKNLLKSYKYLDILGDINPNELNKYYTSYYINRVVFDEEVPNDSIYVTDWICECLKYYKKISYDNYQDVINQKIEIKNHKFTIKKVIDTGILDLYPMSTTLSDENIYVKYAQTLEERTLIYLNKATFLNNLYDSSNNLRVDIGINQYEIASLNNITLFYGNKPEKDNELSLSESVLEQLTNNYNLTKEELEAYVGEKIELTINNKKGEYVVSGICDVDHKIFLTESGIQNFIEYYELDEIKQRGYQRQIQIRDINILDENIILYLAECNAISFYRDDTHNSATLYNLLSYCSNFTNMFLVLAVVFIIILFISLIYFSINNVHKNKQNIGLLASYGLNKKNICINYMLPNLIVLLVAIVPTIVFGNLIIYAMNKQLMITQCIDFSIYNFNLLFCFVGVVISSFIIIILTLIPINKYLQKDLKDIIYLE